MKLYINITTFQNGIAVKTLEWEEEIFDHISPKPFGAGFVTMDEGKVIIQLHDPENSEVLVCKGERVPFQTLNGQVHVGEFEGEMRVGDVLVIYYDTGEPSLVYKEIMMVLSK